MKILIALLLLSTVVNGQQDSVYYKNVGYCGTTRLKDIDAPYGEAAFTGRMLALAGTKVKEFVFDYGQHYKKDKDAMIKDGAGNIIYFNSIAHVLNFFDYNGWEYISTVDLSGSYIVLFKRKSKP